jgi:hypothetical protein
VSRTIDQFLVGCTSRPEPDPSLDSTSAQFDSQLHIETVVDEIHRTSRRIENLQVSACSMLRHGRLKSILQLFSSHAMNGVRIIRSPMNSC